MFHSSHTRVLNCACACRRTEPAASQAARVSLAVHVLPLVLQQDAKVVVRCSAVVRLGRTTTTTCAWVRHLEVVGKAEATDVGT